MSKKKKSLKIPTHAGSSVNFGQLIGSSSALVCADIINSHDGFVLIVTDDMQKTLKLQDDLEQFTSLPCMLFPDWETLPYDNFSPDPAIISERLSCFYKLASIKKGALLLPVSTLMQKCCPPTFLTKYVLIIKQGQFLSKHLLCSQCEQAGYHAVTQVTQNGEYAVRGSLLDVFPMGSAVPYRIDFFDDNVDSIRIFDAQTQRSITEVDSINLLPAHEFPFDKQAIELFRSQWREKLAVNRDTEHVYQQVSRGMLPSGIEYWQPLFFEKPLVTLFSYLPKNTLIVVDSGVQSAAEEYWKNINQRYEIRCVDPVRPLLSPTTLWLTVESLSKHLKMYPNIVFYQDKLIEKKGNINFLFLPLPIASFNQKSKKNIDSLVQFCTSFEGKIIFFVESEGRYEGICNLLQTIKLIPKKIKSLAEAKVDDHNRFYLMISSVEHGFIDSVNCLAFVTESDLLGQRFIRHQKERKRAVQADTLIRSLSELTPGKPIVHLEHGIGRYVGLASIEANGIMGEYLVLSYANDAKLYVPVSSLNLISHYSGGDEKLAPHHKLGTEHWAKAKQKAAEKVRDAAAELLDIYAQRAINTGFTFKINELEYKKFSHNFCYEVTKDQDRAIQETINDMSSPIAMDRLICGDVGFGKTEVAMRAAFLAVTNHKQVAVLVPTTLLAQQHYDNFMDRFADWPVCIETISRFKTAKEQQQILKKLKEGKIDIIIGTHKLLQDDIKWHDLGLLIVDEEHRFGVRQKDRIKSMRAGVDILTLTATPIPRTLNMAIHNVRDLSIITTPPARRLAVKTFVHEYDKLVVKEALLREILRGGQVYYLHNDVRNIDRVKQEISELVVGTKVAVAHGKMNERDLEQVMSDFQHRKFNILVCTTIIETGIDIPNANTIIIERADKFGLAQLHQLRGRVGRSYHQAYAYLLTPNYRFMTAEAKKRLDAISSLEELGVGFALATHDLEIRGVGELLGEEQSGQITAIGFTLYMKLLEDAVNNLKQGKNPSLKMLTTTETDIKLYLPVLIPEDFIPDVNIRLSFYRRIAAAVDHTELRDIRAEMMDRFGSLPEPVNYLFDITLLKRQAEALGISRIEFSERGGFIQILEDHRLSVDFLVSMIRTEPEIYRLNGNQKIQLLQKELSRKERLEFVKQLIHKLLTNKN